MSNQVLPLASYGLRITPGEPTAPIDPEVDYPCSIRLTMAAVDPSNAVDGNNTPSTLRIVRPLVDVDEEDEEADDDEDIPTSETVVCTLNPKTFPQQTLDVVITLGEDVLFHVSGSYPIHLTGNLIEHPYDGDSEEEDSEEEDSEEGDSEEDELDGEEYDLTPDEDELAGEDIAEKIRSLQGEDIDDDSSEEEIDEEELRKLIAAEKAAEKAAADKSSKRKAPAAKEEPKEKKQKADKKVEFSQELEKKQGASEAKYPTKKLEGGVITEDRTQGEGRIAKKGDSVGVRYVGKLKNGKVFDKNTSGKPFYFKLGVGEVIKGWDVGVQGMKIKGERRIIIPAAMAYGRKGVPGIPGNSELTFDVKLVNIK